MLYHFRTLKNGNLKPSNKQTFEAMLKLGEDAFIKAEFKTERNPRHSAKYWALMSCIYQHIRDHFTAIKSSEKLSHIIQYLIARDGHKVAGTFIKLQSGMFFDRTSLAFGSMSQEKFSKYYDLAIDKGIELMTMAGLEIDRDELEKNSEFYYNQ